MPAPPNGVFMAVKVLVVDDSG
ncbi:MAG: hypothetical protein JWP08_4505, partial [Bryobacterales bacterium]|nr:hypothetical protein [Bryobacterales bacterium]